MPSGRALGRRDGRRPPGGERPGTAAKAPGGRGAVLAADADAARMAAGSGCRSVGAGAGDAVVTARAAAGDASTPTAAAAPSLVTSSSTLIGRGAGLPCAGERGGGGDDDRLPVRLPPAGVESPDGGAVADATSSSAPAVRVSRSGMGGSRDRLRMLPRAGIVPTDAAAVAAPADVGDRAAVVPADVAAAVGLADETCPAGGDCGTASAVMPGGADGGGCTGSGAVAGAAALPSAAGDRGRERGPPGGGGGCAGGTGGCGAAGLTRPLPALGDPPRLPGGGDRVPLPGGGPGGRGGWLVAAAPTGVGEGDGRSSM